MTVWVVYSEFNRGYDLEGSAVVEGVFLVFLSEEAANAAAEDARANYREMGTPTYGDGDEDTEDKWGVDVHVESFEVERS